MQLLTVCEKFQKIKLKYFIHVFANFIRMLVKFGFQQMIHVYSYNHVYMYKNSANRKFRNDVTIK